MSLPRQKSRWQRQALLRTPRALLRTPHPQREGAQTGEQRWKMTTDRRHGRGGALCPAERRLELVSANITSLNSQFEAVVALPGSVLILQETRLGELGQRSMRTRLQERGWQAAWGKPQPLIEGSRNTSAWNAAPGGVAVLARVGLPLRVVPPLDDVERRLWRQDDGAML